MHYVEGGQKRCRETTPSRQGERPEVVFVHPLTYITLPGFSASFCSSLKIVSMVLFSHPKVLPWKDFLDMTPNTQWGENGNLDSFEMENVCSS